MSLRGRVNRALHGLTDGGFTRLRRWVRGRIFTAGADTPTREPVIHVIILDGTMSSLTDGMETNAGRTYRLIDEVRRSHGGAKVSVYYEAGIQWRGWKSAWGVAIGKGINAQIRRAYGVLAGRYRPGDKIFLFGYSRGAFAVRSLAGLIGMVGLLKAEHATERNLATAYRHYQKPVVDDATADFARAYCHEGVEIEAICVWDTVMALGLTWPVIWRLYEPRYRFHDAALGPHVKHGFHALARDETREAYAPVLWRATEDVPGHVEQVWFPGSHGDVGGQLGGFEVARPLSNVPLVWMLGRAEAAGLPLPEGWASRFPTDDRAPRFGTWRGWAKMFVYRRRRRRGGDPSERDWVTGEPLFAPTPEPVIEVAEPPAAPSRRIADMAQPAAHVVARVLHLPFNRRAT